MSSLRARRACRVRAAAIAALGLASAAAAASATAAASAVAAAGAALADVALGFSPQPVERQPNLSEQLWHALAVGSGGKLERVRQRRHRHRTNVGRGSLERVRLTTNRLEVAQRSGVAQPSRDGRRIPHKLVEHLLEKRRVAAVLLEGLFVVEHLTRRRAGRAFAVAPFLAGGRSSAAAAAALGAAPTGTAEGIVVSHIQARGGLLLRDSEQLEPSRGRLRPLGKEQMAEGLSQAMCLHEAGDHASV